MTAGDWITLYTLQFDLNKKIDFHCSLPHVCNLYDAQSDMLCSNGGKMESVPRDSLIDPTLM